MSDAILGGEVVQVLWILELDAPYEERWSGELAATELAEFRSPEGTHSPGLLNVQIEGARRSSAWGPAVQTSCSDVEV